MRRRPNQPDAHHGLLRGGDTLGRNALGRARGSMRTRPLVIAASIWSVLAIGHLAPLAAERPARTLAAERPARTLAAERPARTLAAQRPGTDAPLPAPSASPSAAAPAPSHRELLDTYCVTCHNSRTEAGGVALDSPDPARVAEAPDLWERVIRKLRSGTMPPQGAQRPDQPVLTAFVTSLESELDRRAAGMPHPGRPVLRRLNRAEYTNAIRDLLSLDVDVAALLPPTTRATASTTSATC